MYYFFYTYKLEWNISFMELIMMIQIALRQGNFS